jgi:hypothetical protein
MASLLTCSTLFSVLALASAAAQELPKRAGPGDFDLEPKLMLNDLPDVPIPLPPSAAESESDQPPPNVARLEAAVERAKKNAAFRTRLCKAGVFCKLEEEQSKMQVVRLTKDLENARVEAVKREMEQLRKQPPDDDDSALSAAEARLTAAAAAEHDAAAKWDQVLRAAAEIRLQREHVLAAFSATSKSALKRAEAAFDTVIAGPATQTATISVHEKH